MRQIIASGLTAASLLLSVTKPVRAQEYSAECVAAYSERLAMLQEVVAEVIVKEEPVTQKWPDAPTDRPVLLIFTLVSEGRLGAGHRHLHHIVNEQAMLDSTRDLINNCNDIGAVQFGRFRSGDIATFGVLNNGTIDIFQCVESIRGRDLSWGTMYCGI